MTKNTVAVILIGFILTGCAQAASLSGKIDCAGMKAKVMAVPSDQDEKEARWGTLDRLGTDVGADGSYRIEGLGKGTYDLVIGVTLPGRGYPIHHVVALSLSAGLGAEAKDGGDREGIESACRLIEEYSKAHDADVSKRLFSKKFVDDVTLKAISPVHDKKVFIDGAIDKAEIVGLASDGRRANALLKLKLTTKGAAEVKLHGGSYVTFVREGEAWQVVNSKMLWRTREENPTYPVQYTLDKKLTDIILADDGAGSPGHDYSFDMPLIRVSSPAQAATKTGDAACIVKGAIVVPTGAAVTEAKIDLINRKTAGPCVFPIALNDKGEFSCRVDLGSGTNDLQISAVDRKGQRVCSGVLRVERE
ncbi:MAG: hypothetical protein L6455_16510 [Kiritimatiellae bacterium]|nr:hypothetical protein [Kiritimatiellia bacterium]